MPPPLALLIYATLIGCLFWLERDRKTRSSKALWLPTVWVFLAGSRAPSQWLAILGVGQFGLALDSPEQYLEGSPFERVVFTALTVIGIIVLAGRRRAIGIILRANAPVLLFFIYCGVSVLWSDYPETAAKRWIKCLGDPVMVLLVLTAPDPLAALKRVLSRAGFLLLPLSVLFIKYYPHLGREYAHFDGSGSVIGVATNKNSLGVTILMFGLAAVWRLRPVLSGSKGARLAKPVVAHCALLVVSLLLFSMANSATSWSCFLMATVLLVVTARNKWSRKPAVVHVLVVAMVCLSLIAIFVAPNILATMGREQTLTGRTEIWNLVLGMRGNTLLGTGFESFWLGWRREKVWNTYQFHLNEAHNGYLELYLNLGWLGVVLLTLLIVTGYRNAIAALRRDPEVGSLRLAYLFVGIIYALTEAAFRMMSLTWVFFLFAITAIPGGAVSKSRIRIRHAENVADHDPPTENASYAPATQEGI